MSYAACLVLSLTCAQAADAPSLEDGFHNPPPEARPFAWWHWINGNITKEGIRADLEDMKRVGISGVQMIDLEIYLPPGPARYQSDIWNEDVQYAIKTAGELGLQFQMANADGWSESGGPWNTPELSMKQVTWSETGVDGPANFQQALAAPPANLDFYRDIAVVAVPDGPVSEEKPTVKVTAADSDGASLLGDGTGNPIQLSKDDYHPSVTFVYPSQVERRTIEITFADKNVRGRLAGTIECSVDNQTFTKVRDFDFDGGMGSDPSITLSFPPTKALAFRWVLTNPKGHTPWPLAKMQFTDADRVENFHTKTVTADLTSVIPTSMPATSDQAAIPPGQSIDLTSHLDKNGVLTWQVPPGRWSILRFGYTTTGATNHPAQPEGKGLEVDKMDSRAVDNHFDHALGRIIQETAKNKGKAFTGIFNDSWEAGQQNWTANFPTEFQSRRGYDMMPYLPALAGRVVGSPAETEAFLDDFRRTISDLVSEKYFGTLRDDAHKNGLQFSAETYAGVCFNEYQAASHTDTNMGEFWISGMGNEHRRIKKMSSITHVLGRTILSAESFTAKPEEGRWLQMPSNLKPIGDLAFAQGLNKMCFHSYTMQPRSDLRPGFTLGRYGTHFGRQNSWWTEGAKPWIDYLSRCQFLLQQGKFKADFLCLHSGDIDFLVDDPALKLPFGYQYDFINPLQLMDTTADKGLIQIPNGATYRALILPQPWVADIPTLQHLQVLVKGGAALIGPPPVAPFGLKDVQNKAAWQSLVDQLWPGDLAKQTTRQDQRIKDYLQASSLAPDLQISAETGNGIKWIHRNLPDGDLYFLANSTNAALSFTAHFRVSQKQPELWDAVAGTIQPATVFNATDGGTSFDLKLDAGGSIFVVFRKPLPPKWTTSVANSTGEPAAFEQDLSGQSGLVFSVTGTYTITSNDGSHSTVSIDKLAEPVILNSPWEVKFQPPGGGASFTRDFPTLRSWTESQDAQVRYFSGPATYQTTFTMPEGAVGQECRLDLGRVCDLASVKVNGQEAGTLWTPPFATDITSLLKPGRNTLEVTVANRWVNRLIGDEQFPPDAKYQVAGGKFTIGKLMEFPDWYNDPAKEAKRQRTTFATWKFYDKDSPLLESGLIGPVTLRFSRVVADRK